MPNFTSTACLSQDAQSELNFKNRPILVVLHQENSTPGRVGVKLRELGYQLDIRKPRFGDSLPASLDDHEAAIIFGGPMSVNDNEDWIKQEIDWVNVPLKEQRPFLGLCLGAQMLTKVLGGDVIAKESEEVEIGYYPIEPTDLGKQYIPHWPHFAYQWHSEWMRVPEAESRLLAKGSCGSHQAFIAGESSFGIQFHPEVTRAMIHRWTTRGHPRLSLPGAKNRRQHIRDRFEFDPAVDRWLNEFISIWLSR